MKILFISPTFRPQASVAMGGGEISNIALLQWLSGRGHEVFVLTRYSGGLLGCLTGGIHIEEWGGVMAWQPFPETFGFWSARANSIRNRCGQVDIVIGVSYGVPYLNALASRWNIPSVALVRAYENFRHNAAFNRQIRNIFWGEFFEGGLSKVDGVISNSIFMNNFIFDNVCFQGNPQGFVVYPPVCLGDVVKPNLSSGCVVMVGAKIEKGIDTFLLIARALPEFKFKIIGCTRVIHDVPANVDLLGWCDSIDVFLNEASLVLVPSVWKEPFGRVAVEALLCRTPALVSDKGGLPEAVGFDDRRIVIGSVDAWVNKVKNVMYNMAAFSVGDVEVLKISRKYSVESCGSEFEEALSIVVGG